METVFFVQMGLFGVGSIYQLIFSFACISSDARLGRIGYGPFVSLVGLVAGIFAIAAVESHLTELAAQVMVGILTVFVAAAAVMVAVKGTTLLRVLAIGSFLYSIQAAIVWSLMPFAAAEEERSDSFLLTPEEVRLEGDD